MIAKTILSDSFQVDGRTRHLHFTEDEKTINVEVPGGEAGDDVYQSEAQLRDWVAYYQRAIRLIEKGKEIRGAAAKLLTVLVLAVVLAGCTLNTFHYMVTYENGTKQRCVTGSSYVGTAYQLSDGCVTFVTSGGDNGIVYGPIFCGTVQVEEVPSCPPMPAEANP